MSSHSVKWFHKGTFMSYEENFSSLYSLMSVCLHCYLFLRNDSHILSWTESSWSGSVTTMHSPEINRKISDDNKYYSCYNNNYVLFDRKALENIRTRDFFKAGEAMMRWNQTWTCPPHRGTESVSCAFRKVSWVTTPFVLGRGSVSAARNSRSSTSL